MRSTGLSSAEVAERIKQGLVNDFEPQATRSIPVIIIKNIFIIFNVLLAPLFVVLVAMGQYKDVMSVGGVALANTLINMVQEIQAKLALDRIKLANPATCGVIRDGEEQQLPVQQVVQGDYLVLKAGERALADGPVVEARNLEMDESLLTGESDYIPKEQQDEVLSGSYAVAGQGVYIAEKIGEEAYMQRVVNRSRKQVAKKSPLERKVGLLVNTFMGLCFTIAAVLILRFWPLAGKVEPVRFIVASVTTLIPQGLVLIVTITFALGVIAFAKRGIIFRRINAVESLANVDMICMDKTGTLTHNRIMLDAVSPVEGVTVAQLEERLRLFGNIIEEKNKTSEALAAAYPAEDTPGTQPAEKKDEIPFKSRNKFSAARVTTRQHGTEDLLLGAYEMVSGGLLDHDREAVQQLIRRSEEQGQRTLVFAWREAPAGESELSEELHGYKLGGVIAFSEEIKAEAPEILAGFRRKGVRQVVISGDSLTTVQSIALRIGLEGAEHGVTGQQLAEMDEKTFRETALANRIFARISPDQKYEIIRVFKKQGWYTSMVGDGVNDVLALKESDLAIAMGSGGSMAKEVSDIILVNNKFDLLPELLDEGDKIISRIQDCARIFTLKNFYALFMVSAALIAGLSFPFFPQQITLINFVTITIPLLYLIKFSDYKAKVEKQFLKDIVRFSAVFGTVIAAAGLTLNALYTKGLFGFPVEPLRYAQSAAIFPVIILALLSYLYLINRAGRLRSLLRDKKILLITLLLAALFPLAMYFAPFRKFFELIPFAGRDWLLGAAVLLPAGLVQYLLMRRYMGNRK